MRGGLEDIDITNTDMSRFGDDPQGFIERNVKIGEFELKTDDISVNFVCAMCYTFATSMYVWENTGNDWWAGIFVERKVRMADFPITGGGCCAQ
jgi:hypothetical protein